DLLAHLRRAEAEGRGPSPQVAFAGVVRELQLDALGLPRFQADERFSEARDPERLPCLDVRVAGEGRDFAIRDRRVNLHGDDVAVGLVDEVGPRVIPEMLLPIRPLVHRARRLARAETRDLRALHVPLKGRVRGAGEPTGVDFRLDDHCRAGLAPDRVADGRGYGLRRFVHGRAQVYWVRLHAMFYYEIHDGDEDLGTAVLLAHEQHFEPAEF